MQPILPKPMLDMAITVEDHLSPLPSLCLKHRRAIYHKEKASSPQLLVGSLCSMRNSGPDTTAHLHCFGGRTWQSTAGQSKGLTSYQRRKQQALQQLIEYHFSPL
jgi:hypothetical protein